MGIESALRLNRSINNDDIDLEVSDIKFILTGTVKLRDQREEVGKNRLECTKHLISGQRVSCRI